MISGKIASFDSLAQCLLKPVHLKSLTIEAEGQSDLIDARRWEKFLQKTQICNFNFRLGARNTSADEGPLSVLERFRSSFWLEENCWYVGCTQRQPYWERTPITEIFSLPYFRPQIFFDDMQNFPPLSTAPAYMYDKLFYQNRIISYEYRARYKERLFNHRFNKVKKLSICTAGRESVELCHVFDNLSSLADLQHVEELDLSSLYYGELDSINLLLTHTSRLHTIIMNRLEPLLIIPEHIHSLILRKITPTIYPINHHTAHQLSRSLPSIRHLEVPVPSRALIVDIIDHFIQLTSLLFLFDSERSGILDVISTEWFEQNTRRLKKNACNQNQLDLMSTMNSKLHDPCSISKNNFTWYRRWTMESYKQAQGRVCGRFRPNECICLSMMDSLSRA